MKLLDLIPGVRSLRGRLAVSERRAKVLNTAITAARHGGRDKGWMGMPDDEDAANKEYANNRPAILQRSQDLDVNNPDVGGFNRMRVAQLISAGVDFKHNAKAEEIGLTETQAVAVGEKLNRLRKLHSENGGFDSQHGVHWEGKQQERALLTMFVYGCCLIHRVWKTSGQRLLPLSLELIPGSRISTPIDKYGDPLISYGVQYTDDHRSEVVGYWVRRVSKTVGNNFVPDFEWDFVHAEDCSLLTLTEPAGIDQALPLCTRTMRGLRNRGEFVENTVEAVRAQSKHYGITECAPGVNPFNVAMDDRDPNSQSSPMGFVDLGDGVLMLYTQAGEKVTWSSAKLPEPEFAAFMEKTDERMARGLNCSLSAFTRKVTSSWAGGRMESQQDVPIIDQYRTSLLAAWQKVNGWILEACWLSGKVDLPGFSNATRVYWNQFRAEFPEKPDVNPQDTAGASEKNLMLRRTTPQREIEKAGGDARQTLEGWARWIKMTREIEKKFDLDEGSLDVLFSGKTVTSMIGDELGAATPIDEPEPGENQPGTPPVKKNPTKTNGATNGANGHRLSKLLGAA